MMPFDIIAYFWNLKTIPMPKIFVAFTMLILFLTSCKDKEQKAEQEKATSLIEAHMIKSEKPISRLNSKSEELISSWPEYQKFDELINQYQEISMSEALLNSVELSELAMQLRDSIRIEKLDVPEVKIRLNVLYSETLRLADMSTIPTITEALVSRENNNVIDAYSALNLKINNMSAQDELNEEISKFVDEILEERKSDSLELSDEGDPNK
jgi:hypothetical protein